MPRYIVTDWPRFDLPTMDDSILAFPWPKAVDFVQKKSIAYPRYDTGRDPNDPLLTAHHELGHLFCALAINAAVDEVCLCPPGTVNENGQEVSGWTHYPEAISSYQMAIIAAGGPMASNLIDGIAFSCQGNDDDVAILAQIGQDLIECLVIAKKIICAVTSGLPDLTPTLTQKLIASQALIPDDHLREQVLQVTRGL